MEDCPPEILHIIFTQACAGPSSLTSQSLCLTSKYISAVSTPLLYCRLSISGLSSIQRTLEHLVKVPAHANAVRHLFISDKGSSSTSASSITSEKGIGLNDVHSIAAVGRSYTSACSDRRDAAFLSPIFASLLHLLSPTLQTLTCLITIIPQHTLLQILNGVAFPQLTNLTLRLSESRLSRTPNPDQLSDISMPYIRSLHISSTRYLSSFTAPAVTAFASRCADLTEVKLSCVRLTAGSAAIICRLLGREPARDLYGWAPSKQRLEEFKRLDLAGGDLRVEVEDGFEGGMEGLMVNELGKISREDAAPGNEVGFVVLPTRGERSYEEWWDEWRQTVDEM